MRGKLWDLTWATATQCTHTHARTCTWIMAHVRCDCTVTGAHGATGSLRAASALQMFIAPANKVAFASVPAHTTGSQNPSGSWCTGRAGLVGAIKAWLMITRSCAHACSSPEHSPPRGDGGGGGGSSSLRLAAAYSNLPAQIFAHPSTLFCLCFLRT